MKAQWLLLLHQIPPKPQYFRAKVLRRLLQVGALPVKNSAYLLPNREDSLEDFEWICQEIKKEGGSAWLFLAETVIGLSNVRIEDSFRRLRQPEYEEMIQEAASALEQEPILKDELVAAQRRISQRYEEVGRVDFFDSPGRGQLEELMSQIEAKVNPANEPGPGLVEKGRIWVTRRGVKVDRIGSAWLVRRFIDPQATFRFVNPDGYQHAGAEIRFDMFEGEYTHVGDLCTFEVLLAASDPGRQYPSLRAIAEIVHDIDLKDDRFRRPETAGVAALIKGLCLRTPDDESRLQKGAVIFDSLFESLVD
jgi:hypothetical protein